MSIPCNAGKGEKPYWLDMVRAFGLTWQVNVTLARLRCQDVIFDERSMVRREGVGERVIGGSGGKVDLMLAAVLIQRAMALNV
jgi:hypothetical protein